MKLYTVAEAAQILGVSNFTLNQWRRKGRIGCVENGPGYIRFTQAHLDAFVKANTRAAR
jgi:excisionase family DNA binding protein